MRYQAIRDCIWQGKYWYAGDLTDPLHPDIVPCRHFEKYKQTKTTEEPEKELTMSQITDQLVNANKSTTGINSVPKQQRRTKK